VRRVCGIFTMLVSVGLLVACVGRFVYVRPAGVETAALSRIVAKSADEVWQHAAATPSQGRFAVTGLDRDAGVITLTYSGDPEPYVDCGSVASYVKNARGERTYRFPAASASADYELMTGKEIVSIARQMALDARIAVTAAPIANKETRVSVSAHYALSRTMHIRDTQGSVQTVSHLARFTSDDDGTFPGAVVCRASGKLEADVLSAVTP
jgi:hypothetical protein